MTGDGDPPFDTKMGEYNAETREKMAGGGDRKFGGGRPPPSELISTPLGTGDAIIYTPLSSRARKTPDKRQLAEGRKNGAKRHVGDTQNMVVKRPEIGNLIGQEWADQLQHQK